MWIFTLKIIPFKAKTFVTNINTRSYKHVDHDLCFFILYLIISYLTISSAA